MKRSSLRLALVMLPIWMGCLAAEEVLHETFDKAATTDLFKKTYGDDPASIEANGASPAAGRDGGPGGRLKLVFGDKAEKKLSYWEYRPEQPIPILTGITEISFWVKANVPVSLKIALSPYGFIYHAPAYTKIGEWQKVALPNAYEQLKAWCERGGKDPAWGMVSGIIVAVVDQPNATAEIFVDDIVVEGTAGTAEAAKRASFERKSRKVRVGVVSQIWSDEGRTLPAVIEKIEEAARDGADIVALPQECVKTGGEPIPGPISNAISAQAKKSKIYVIGNIREKDDTKTYVTSFLCDREGKIAGKYRKSHKMPDEDMDLGDDLPVFKTDFGVVAMRVGTDRFFADIDHVYTAKGACAIFWSQMPEPVEDEFSQDFPSAGRAVDYQVVIACSRYAYAKQGWITNKYPPYCGCPIGRAYVINREGQRVASTARTGGGVAIATIPHSQLGNGRAKCNNMAFKCLTEKLGVPQKPAYLKRKVRLTVIESHLGIETLVERLDEAGKMGSDIACLYELVWISGGKNTKEQVEQMTKQARANLGRIAEKAKQYKMYVLIGGVVDRLERNEAILFDRTGEIVWRYFKIAKTHDEQIPGEETPVYDTDFGRISARICADEWMVELDRSYGVKGADIIFTPTQSWGPDALFRELRDISRAMDAGLFHVQCTHEGTEVHHRSMIVEPTGVVVARSEYRKPSLVTALVDLDNDRPMRYVREYKPHTPGGYLPEYQPDQMPAAKNDLRETILQQRRPELYGALAPEPKAPEKK